MGKETARQQSPKLFERERELEAIEAALAGARAGEGRLLYIEAHAGIGKSGLLTAAREQAAATGIEVLAARGSLLERDHSFGVTTQLLEPPVLNGTDAEREDLLGGAAALARPLFEDHAVAAAAPDDQLFTLLHGLYWLTSNLAERPRPCDSAGLVPIVLGCGGRARCARALSSSIASADWTVCTTGRRRCR